MGFDFAALEPAPSAMVANLPYSVATPVLLRTIEELPSISRWTVMVQREIADRLRAAPGSRTYGSPSVIAQLACEVKLVRTRRPGGLPAAAAGRVGDPRPAPHRARRRPGDTGPGARRLRPPPQVAGPLARARPARRARRRPARRSPSSGCAEDARAEALSPADFAALCEKLKAA